MTWRHPAWTTLGLDPTSDARAIRSAYAAKLKAIDPEADPGAFVTLRDAFEAAKVQAQWVDEPDEDEDEALWDEEDEAWTPSGDLYQIRPSGQVPQPPPPDPAWETPAPPEPPAPAPEAADPYWQAVAPPEKPERASPWAPLTPEEADAHSRALATLLYTHDRVAEPWPNPAQEEAMLAHWRAVTADPRLQEVSYYADAERWFSELIARTSAFSDPLVIPATELFGWLASDGTITQTHAIAHVTRRYRMLEFQRAVKQPKHPLFPAWRELVRKTGNRTRRGSVSGRKVRQLLRIVRTNYPDLEGCFDPYRVALWDGSHIGTGGGGPGWGRIAWVVGFFLFLVIRAAVSFDTDRNRAPVGADPPVAFPQDRSYVPPMQVPPSGPIPSRGSQPPSFPIILDGELQASDADLDQALENLFGDTLDIATISLRAPALYQALQDFWAREKAAGVRKGQFAEDLADFLNRRYPEGIRKGEPSLFSR